MALQKIKLSNGRIREVQEHLAFDKALQQQQGFVPCNEDGTPLPPTGEKKSSHPKEAAAAANATAPVEISEDSERQIREAYSKGLSCMEIAKVHGLHWKKVEAIVTKATA